jgi:hypothetical protein
MKNGLYTLVIAPPNYPGKKYRGRYCYEHSLVAWKKYHRLPEGSEEVHHINDNKRDNRPENVEYLTAEEHKKYHGALRAVPPVVIPCCFCEGTCFIVARNHRHAVKCGRTEFHCSRKCSIKHQRTKGLMRKGGRKPKVWAVPQPGQDVTVTHAFTGSNPVGPAS